MSLDLLGGGLHTIWTPARIWTAMVASTRCAPTREKAYQFKESDLRASTIIDLDEVPYANDFAEPWAAPLAAIRFAEVAWGARRRDFIHAHHRWASDHHMAVRLRPRCPGDALPEETPFKLEVERPLCGAHLMPMVWLDRDVEKWILTTQDHGFAMRADYAIAVETAYPRARWEIPRRSEHGPALAYSGHGLVAAVMGVAIHDRDALFELDQEDEQTWKTVQAGLSAERVRHLEPREL